MASCSPTHPHYSPTSHSYTRCLEPLPGHFCPFSAQCHSSVWSLLTLLVSLPATVPFPGISICAHHLLGVILHPLPHHLTEAEGTGLACCGCLTHLWKESTGPGTEAQVSGATAAIFVTPLPPHPCPQVGTITTPIYLKGQLSAVPTSSLFPPGTHAAPTHFPPRLASLP